jgi:hypothetical protein
MQRLGVRLCASPRTRYGGRVLRMQSSSRANLIDTAELYEPEPSERLIAQALHPYPGLFALNPESAARSLGRFRPRG